MYRTSAGNRLAFGTRRRHRSIPGTGKVHRLDENVGALNVKLTPEDLKRIDKIAPPHAAEGARYTDAMMKYVDKSL